MRLLSRKMAKQTCWKQARLSVWKQNRSNTNNKNILNSLVAIIHKNKCNTPAMVKRLWRPGPRLEKPSPNLMTA